MNLDPEDRTTIRAGLWTIYATAAIIGGAITPSAAADTILAAQTERWPDLAEPPVEPDIGYDPCKRESDCVFAEGHVQPCRDRRGHDATIPF